MGKFLRATFVGLVYAGIYIGVTSNPYLAALLSIVAIVFLLAILSVARAAYGGISFLLARGREGQQ